jgi:hypothetical protein
MKEKYIFLVKINFSNTYNLLICFNHKKKISHFGPLFYFWFHETNEDEKSTNYVNS